MSDLIDGRKSAEKTDERVWEMERYLRELYSRAAAEMHEKSRKYFEQFEAADKKKRKEVASGKLSEEEYKKWRKNKLLYGRRFADFERKITEELANVNQTALDYINGKLPEIYVINYNDTGTSITDDVNGYFGAGISFDLVDADTIQLLAENDSDLLPDKKLDKAKDERWNARKLRSELLQGILQGESIPEIADRLEKLFHMNREAAIRNARTMVTAAQNRGRLEGMIRSEGMGVILKRTWMSAEDGRVRDAHAELDGQERRTEEPFENSIGKIMYPGDPHAHPANVYNCRCTMGTDIIGFRDPVTGKVTKI